MGPLYFTLASVSIHFISTSYRYPIVRCFFVLLSCIVSFILIILSLHISWKKMHETRFPPDSSRKWQGGGASGAHKRIFFFFVITWLFNVLTAGIRSARREWWYFNSHGFLSDSQPARVSISVASPRSKHTESDTQPTAQQELPARKKKKSARK